MRLETERLRLREFTAADLDDLAEMLTDPRTMEFMVLYSREQTAQFLRDFCLCRKPPGGYAVEERATGRVMGYVLFKEIDEPGIWELGWVINRAYWRQGYASEVCAAVIAYGFQELELHKICAETDDPVRSGGLAEKLGMRREGVFRQHSRQADGSWKDLHWYGLLRSDWARTRSEGRG